MHRIPTTGIRVLAFVFALLPACTWGEAFAAENRRATRPWPLRSVGRQGAASLRVAPEPGVGALEALELLDAVRFDQVEMPDGRRLDLELTRVRPIARDCVFAIDGGVAPMAPDDGLTLWSGRVEGEPAGRVFLAFSRAGSRGVIDLPSRRYHLVAERGAGGRFEGAGSRLEVALPGEDLMAPFACGETAIEQPFWRMLHGPTPSPPSGGGASESPPPAAASYSTIYDCTIAVETDYQLYQKFNDAQALGNYVATLFGAISARYQEDVGVSLTVNYVGVWTTSSDPWAAPDGGGNTSTMLSEFQNEWGGGQAPVTAKLYHFLSGASLGGGIAWLDVLCAPWYAFGVSGNLSGNLTTPVSQGYGTWDFVVAAHEIGHNFGTQHTHDYCPPIDQCAGASYFGPCQTQQVCSQGTIMSYCHTCSGGMSNIQIGFGPIVSAVMRDAADDGCLPVASSVPDLAAAALSGPSSATIGESITLSARVDSVGAAYAGSYDYQVRLSSDSVITSSDPVIVSGTGTALNSAFDVEATIPLLTALGSYRLGLTLDNVASETNAANGALDGDGITIQAGSGPPELVAVDVTGPASVSPGEVVSLTRTIVNTGGALAGSFTYEVRLTQNAVVTENDVLVASVSSAATGQLVMSGVTIPESIASGSWSYGLIVTPATGETDTSDNAVVGDAVAVSSVAGVATLFVPGDQLLGSIAGAGDADGVGFDAVAGEQVAFTLSAAETGLSLELSIAPDGGSATVIGTLAALDSVSFAVPSTGRYQLGIVAAGGTGAYTLDSAPDFAGALTQFEQKLASADGKTQHVLVPAIPGATLDVTAKGSKKLKAKSVGGSLLDPSGAVIDIAPSVTVLKAAGKKGFSLKDVYLDAAGDFELVVSGVKGPGKPVTVKGTITLPIGTDVLTID